MKQKMEQLDRTGALTLDEVLEAAEEQTGFCMNCGEAHDCEPDARCYECYECGEFEVFGATEIIMECG